MGTSFTQLSGHGFWTTDSKLEVWLMALCDEVDARREQPEWLTEARDHWQLQATGGFGGCVAAGLDEIVGSDPSRVAAVRELASNAIDRLRSDRTLTRQVLTTNSDGGVEWRVGVEAIVPVARAFDDLLAGRLTTDAATSPVF